jgi:hypothetical protein
LFNIIDAIKARNLLKNLNHANLAVDFESGSILSK